LRHWQTLRHVGHISDFHSHKHEWNVRCLESRPYRASMQAAAHPAHVDYLYFVRKPDKVHHYFTASFQDFQNHEIQYGFGK